MLGLILAISVLATLAGGAAPVIDRVVARAGLWRVQAFRSGILIAVAFADVLPEAWRLAPTAAGWGALAAFAFCYALESLLPVDPCREASEDCRQHPLRRAALVGLCLHAVMDGVNLGASALAGSPILLGVGTAVVLHKLADGFTLSTYMDGGSPGLRRAALLTIALATPLGAAGGAAAQSLDPRASALLLAFAGGSFVYVGAADIVPRLHGRGRPGSSLACFGAGLTSMLLLRRLGR